LAPDSNCSRKPGSDVCGLSQMPKNSRANAASAVTRLHVGEGRAHLVQPDIGLGIADRGLAAHFLQRAPGNLVADEAARVLDLQRQRLRLPVGRGDGGGRPQADLINLQAQEAQACPAAWRQAGQFGRAIGPGQRAERKSGDDGAAGRHRFSPAPA
jgi:hypothetical protein